MEVAAIGHDPLSLLGSAPFRAQEGEGRALSFEELVAMALGAGPAPSKGEEEVLPSPSGGGKVGEEGLEVDPPVGGEVGAEVVGLLGVCPSPFGPSAMELLRRDEPGLERGGEEGGLEGLVLPGSGVLSSVEGACALEASGSPSASKGPWRVPPDGLRSPLAASSPGGSPSAPPERALPPRVLSPVGSFDVGPRLVAAGGASSLGVDLPSGGGLVPPRVRGEVGGGPGACRPGGPERVEGQGDPHGRPAPEEGLSAFGGDGLRREVGGGDPLSPGGDGFAVAGMDVSREDLSPLASGAETEGEPKASAGLERSPEGSGEASSSAPEGKGAPRVHRSPGVDLRAPRELAQAVDLPLGPSRASPEGSSPRGADGRLRLRDLLGRMPLGARALYALRELPEGTLGGIEGALRMVISSSKGFARLKVWPPSLGEMELRVEVSGDRVEASLGVRSAVAYEHLSSRLDGLVGSLREAGFGEVKVNVGLLPDGGDGSGGAPSGGRERPRPFGLMGEGPSVETSGEEELSLLGVVSSGSCSVEVWA